MGSITTVQTNSMAMTAKKNLDVSGDALATSMGRLSSGYRINSAKDDAAGLSIAGTLRTNTKSYEKAAENTAQGNSMVQIAEGGMDQIENIVNRLKQLATQSASSTTDANGRIALQTEFSTLLSEIDRIANSTKYGSTQLLDGTFGNTVAGMTAGVTSLGIAGTSSIDVSGASGTKFTVTDSADNNITMTNGSVQQTVALSGTGAQTINFDKLGVKITVDSAYSANNELNNVAFTVGSSTQYLQVGTTSDSNDNISLSIGNMDTSALYGGTVAMSTWSIASVSTAQLALDSLDSAIGYITSKRGDLGAIQNRLGYASANLATTITNTKAAESTIRDTDMAAEMTSLTKNQILVQAGTAMLGQANQAPQVTLSIISG